MADSSNSANLPSHLEGLPTLDDAEFVLAGLSNDELRQLPVAVNGIQLDLDIAATPGGTRYLVLGSYDTTQSDRAGPKDRLVEAQNRLEELDPQSTAVLLEDLDPDSDDWRNFYVKFRYTMVTTDFNVLVAEDNDGGHELELGEATLSETYVAKRDYRHASVDKDIEYEKYDAMIATLFKLMDRRGHLFEWRTPAEFRDAIEQISTETRGKTTRS
jgi:hypothetical protein